MVDQLGNMPGLFKKNIIIYDPRRHRFPSLTKEQGGLIKYFNKKIILPGSITSNQFKSTDFLRDEETRLASRMLIIVAIKAT